MASAALLRHVADSAPDADLLRRFVHGREPDAFAELVRRHGPVVYRVCRRLLGATSADDAFQATFLILATRPESVRKAGSVGSWLVGVAGRVARQMRKRERRFLASRGRQPPESSDPRGADAPRSPELAEQFRILDEELTRLPDRLRGPVVVCLLQGRTQEQAVAELGGSVRTIRRRLEEAKQLLRLRLERRGVVPALAAGLASGVGEATATVPPDLPGRTVATVFDFLAGGSAVSAPAAVIAKGVAMGTLAGRVKLAMVSAAVGLTALGVGVAGDEKPIPEPKPAAPPVRPAALAVPNGKARLPGLPPPPVAPVGWAVTTVYPNTAVGRALMNEVEFQRREIARRWLGEESQLDKRRPLHVAVIEADDPIPPPPTGSLIVLYRRGGSAESSSELTFADSRLTRPRVHLAGPLEDVLENDLPREMTHVVLANHVGKPLPRWAADGAARIAESPTRQAEYDVYCRSMLTEGTAFHLSWLFQFDREPKNQFHVVAEEHSITRYLLTRKAVFRATAEGDRPLLNELWRKTPEAAFLAFAQLGAEGDWDKAVKEIYGFDDVAALEKAWIGWLNSPESRLAKGAEPRRPVRTFQRNMPESWYIPAVKVP